MAFEKVQVIADGVVYEGWESVTIVSEMLVIFAFAQLLTTEKGGIRDVLNPAFTEWKFPPGTRIEILASGDPIFMGIVDIYEPTITADHHQIALTVVTPSKHFSTTSIHSQTGNYENKTDHEMVSEWAAFLGLIVRFKSAARLIKYWQIKQGASPFQETMRMFMPGGKMLWSDPTKYAHMVEGDGAPEGLVTNGMIVQGVNITKMSARLTDEQLSTWEVIGQGADGDNMITERFQPNGIAVNPFFSGAQFRYRKTIEQTATNSLQATIRAKWNMNRSLHRRLQAQFTVPGWRTGGTEPEGPFWEVNWDVFCHAPYLKIDCTLRIFKVVFNQDGNGTSTTIYVTDGASFGGKVSECSEGRRLEEFFSSQPHTETKPTTGGPR